MTTATYSEYNETLTRVREAGGIIKVLGESFNGEAHKRTAKIMGLARAAGETAMPVFTEKMVDLPLPIQELLRDAAGKPDGKWTHVFIGLMRPPHGGQEGGGNKNLMAIIMPTDNAYTGGIVTVEVGCDHRFSARNLGRCYNEYRCTECDYYYRVDSSD